MESVQICLTLCIANKVCFVLPVGCGEIPNPPFSVWQRSFPDNVSIVHPFYAEFGCQTGYIIDGASPSQTSFKVECLGDGTWKHASRCIGELFSVCIQGFVIQYIEPESTTAV